MDLSSFAHSLQTWAGQAPPAAVGLALLAGPTLVLVLYRFITVARRVQGTTEVTAATLWVCHSCRSVNELRVSRCYRCARERDASGKIEFIVDRPEPPARLFDVPAGSPFAGAADAPQRTGVPVMGQPAGARDPVAVGPGHEAEPVSPPVQEGTTDLVEADR